MTYSWEILKFATRSQVNSEGVELTDSVVSVQWRRTGYDSEGNRGSVVGYTVLSAENVDSDSFVPFDSLTEDLVVSWLESAISAEKLNSYDSTIQDKINRQVTTEKAVPWN